jgi:hypothetical protein
MAGGACHLIRVMQALLLLNDEPAFQRLRPKLVE